ncbi:fumarylacetoacetate hydrolase family protein [Thalassospira lucentensis]|uniref:fumarylacetoacetate hydrolase family protein n=1 Tax=Thalassospira lucentensis TaxID=168935 RepID=UPI0003B2F026|nr:fumarylacetoacetate hydrolase family protein [Thalassospira lucentensis]RCK21746.1 5-carboxymethyl-2-hydroxymuconate isomerase [Thalassospira lucentensis MCCC 1A00383 = DSM 14000]
MKFVTFEYLGSRGFGQVREDMIQPIDAAADLRAYLPAVMKDETPTSDSRKPIPLSAVKLLPPITDPSKIFCVATNFHEPSRAGKPDPTFPLMFTRCADAQTGHDRPVIKPAHSEQYDFEGELAVIIGAPGHKIERAEAMRHVAGYSCFNDGSVRDWQKHSTQFTPGKNFYQSAGFGPWLVTTDEVPDPTALALETRVNGVVKQAIAMDQMIFDIPWLISYISTFAPLHVGDVIVTGTPSGFGSSRDPKEFLSDGDVIEVEISGLGTLRNVVRQDTDPRAPLFSQ